MGSATAGPPAHANEQTKRALDSVMGRRGFGYVATLTVLVTIALRRAVEGLSSTSAQHRVD
jgi:hypothetical protein